MKRLAVLLLCVLSVGTMFRPAFAAELPIVATDDFEHGDSRWELLDPESWRLAELNGNHALSLHRKASDYKPPHRSPRHVALLKSPAVTDFELTVRVRSTHADYPHRDACLFFGYQDAEHFYYVHLGQKTDEHCNQIFIVDGADRKIISTETTAGTPWDEQWHTVRIVRHVQQGKISVYFDDQLAMTATDATFAWGRIGVGSFDDTADFDDLALRGVVPKAAVDHVDPVGVSTRR